MTCGAGAERVRQGGNDPRVVVIARGGANAIRDVMKPTACPVNCGAARPKFSHMRPISGE